MNKLKLIATIGILALATSSKAAQGSDFDGVWQGQEIITGEGQQGRIGISGAPATIIIANGGESVGIISGLCPKGAERQARFQAGLPGVKIWQSSDGKLNLIGKNISITLTLSSDKLTLTEYGTLFNGIASGKYHRKQ
jgi:hypothetical protein